MVVASNNFFYSKTREVVILFVFVSDIQDVLITCSQVLEIILIFLSTLRKSRIMKYLCLIPKISFEIWYFEVDRRLGV